MKETLVYKRVKRIIEIHRGEVLRIENVANVSLPDMLVILHHQIILMEAKVQKGLCIQFNRFQVGMLAGLSEKLPDWGYLVAVAIPDDPDKDTFIYTAKSLVGRFRPTKNYVAVDLTDIQCYCLLSNLHTRLGEEK